jgi:hypothetical protein
MSPDSFVTYLPDRSHGGAGSADDDPDRDPNCVFPLDRLRELEAASVIGGLAEDAVSFVTSYSASRDIERAAKIVVELRRMAVDAVLLVPV